MKAWILRNRKWLGMILIVAGFAIVIFRGIPYWSKEEVLVFGGLRISAAERKQVPISPWVGIGMVAAGGWLALGPAAKTKPRPRRRRRKK